MESELLTTTCPTTGELDRAIVALDALGGEYRLIEPTAPLRLVAVNALVLSRAVRGILQERAAGIAFSGWVEHRASTVSMPEGPEPAATGVCFRRAAIMVHQPCVADETKIRLVAHVEGDLAPVLPYLNAVIPQASYNPTAETLTFLDGRRMIVLYSQRITIAKADEIVDAWETLDRLRRLVEETWARRDGIVPCFETRRKPPALEIFKRLPGTNCGRCGEPSCMAFAMRLWVGEVSVRRCTPVFEPSSRSRREALMEIVAGLGVGDDHGMDLEANPVG